MTDTAPDVILAAIFSLTWCDALSHTDPVPFKDALTVAKTANEDDFYSLRDARLIRIHNHAQGTDVYLTETGLRQVLEKQAADRRAKMGVPPTLKTPDTLLEFELAAFSEETLHRFVAEASSLGLKPGQFPETFRVKGALGNNFPFSDAKPDGHGGYIYQQQLGNVSVAILND